MCGIVGYTGKQRAVPVLLEGLRKLEYRGYDSAGVCVCDNGLLKIVKTKGRIQALREKIHENDAIQGHTGIGHTRWATHGVPSDINSHPHLSNSGKIALVHNGVIENEAVLRSRLLEQGYHFLSETDTEVVANLMEAYYLQCGDFVTAVKKAAAEVEGSFAFGVLCADLPDVMIAMRQNSPLVVGFGEDAYFIASDVPAILKYTKTVCYMDDGEMAVFSNGQVAFQDPNGMPIAKAKEQITWDLKDAERGGYDHFMLKEIYEQPKVLMDTIHPRIRNGRVVLEELDLSAEFLKNLKKIYLVACGSSYYVACLAKYTIERACHISTEALMASEFRYSDPVVDENSLVIVLSQSGETADTLAALREAKRLGAKTLAIVNVVGSAIAKTADHTIYTWAGPEIAVATTKAFSAQLAVIYLLTLHIAEVLDVMPEAEYAENVEELLHLHEAVQRCLTPEIMTQLREYAQRYADRHDAFFVGRNVDSAICQEASLKLKEIAYVHSEAYAAGELKHGPISLIQEGTLVLALATVRRLLDKTMSNVRAVKTRGADVLCVTVEDTVDEVKKYVDHVIGIPQVTPMLQPSLSLIPMQAFAYYMAVARGCDVDNPRNLAKSVTVE